MHFLLHPFLTPDLAAQRAEAARQARRADDVMPTTEARTASAVSAHTFVTPIVREVPSRRRRRWA